MFYGREAHDSVGDRRKYTDEPYYFHSEGAAEILARLGADDEILAGMVLHDVPENVPGRTPDVLSKQFGVLVGGYVREVTNVYTRTAYPDLTRAERTALEAGRLANISEGGKLIKMGDVRENVPTLMARDPKFALTYFREKRDLMERIRVPGSPMHEELYQEIMGFIRSPLNKPTRVPAIRDTTLSQ